MTVSPAISLFMRRASRWLAALAALGAVCFTVVVAWMFFWVLPNISAHRETVANLMSRALGQRVTIEAVSGAWQQASPVFRLQGVRLHDKQDRLALNLPEIEATFAWRSLLFLEPRFTHIELQGLTLTCGARDRHFYVGGIPVNPADLMRVFQLAAPWAFHGQSHAQWLDEVRDAPPLMLEVDFT
jgi:hypothetical protein